MTTTILLLSLAALCLTPFAVYLLAKAATLGYLMGRKRFDETQRHKGGNP